MHSLHPHPHPARGDQSSLNPVPRKPERKFRKIFLILNKNTKLKETWKNWFYMHICIFYWIEGTCGRDTVALEAWTYARKSSR